MTNQPLLPQDEITEAAQDALCQHIVEYSAATTYTVPESAFVHARILFRRGVEWERERKQQSKGTVSDEMVRRAWGAWWENKYGTSQARYSPLDAEAFRAALEAALNG